VSLLQISELLGHYHIDCSLDVAGHESQWKAWGVQRNGRKLPLQHGRPITKALRGVRGRIEYTHYVKEVLHFWDGCDHLCSNKVL